MKILPFYDFPPVIPLILFIAHFNRTCSAQEKPSACSGTTYLNVTQSKQYITTPDYGKSNYPPNMDCYFVLKADMDHRISIEILDLDMEPQLFHSCLDFIGFHEGTQAHFTQPYLTFCGQLSNRQVTSKTDSLTIQFKSDEVVEGRGARISYEAVSYGQCEAGWLRREDGSCYRHLETYPKVGWADAQDQCSQMQANLASIRNREDYEYMRKSFGHDSLIHSWIGYTDADEEGTLTSIDPKSSVIYPNPTLPANDDVKDCLYLDFSYSDQEPYRIADCRRKLTFICQKRNDWSTVVTGDQHQRVRRGSMVATADYTIWLLLLVALILAAIIVCILCQACMKKRDQNRVHTAESSRLVRGSEGQMVQQNATVAKVQQTAPVQYHGAADHTANQTIAPSPSVQTITHENKAEVALSPLPKLVTETDLQRSNLPNQVDENQLIPQSLRIPTAEGTRALPPLPLREATLQSMNTREESFLRSKRSNELFDRPKMNVLKNVSAISLDEFWSNAKY